MKYLFLNNENIDVCLPPYFKDKYGNLVKKTNTRFWHIMSTIHMLS